MRLVPAPGTYQPLRSTGQVPALLLLGYSTVYTPCKVGDAEMSNANTDQDLRRLPVKLLTIYLIVVWAWVQDEPAGATTYAPDIDGEPDPGEVVWAWVPSLAVTSAGMHFRSRSFDTSRLFSLAGIKRRGETRCDDEWTAGNEIRLVAVSEWLAGREK